jgi:hypothetical protein
MRKKILVAAAVLIVAVAGGVIPFMPASKSKPSTASPLVPITAGMAEVKDVPVYLTGLGTVQAFNTVTVNTRVDGQLDKVDFTEGKTSRPAMSWRKLTRVRFRPRSIWQRRPRRRTRRSSPMQRLTSSATKRLR